MKKFHFLLLLFFVCSCNDTIIDNPTPEKETILLRSDPIAEELESKMQWASFIAAIALEKNEDARNELLGLINQDNKTISTASLISPFTMAPHFRETFLEVLDWYSMIICQNGKPEPGVVPPSSYLDPQCSADFINYINVQNCIEFYFPLALDLSPVLPITSTAHPLTEAQSNYGFKRTANTESITSVTLVKVSPYYLVDAKDVIVARPKSSVTCDYSQYPVEDFTVFLEN